MVFMRIMAQKSDKYLICARSYFLNCISTMNKDNELTEKLNNMLIASAEKESVIKFLRLSNYSKAESIGILKKALSISYCEAQDMWSDVKEFDAKLMNDFLDVLEELGSSESEET